MKKKLYISLTLILITMVILLCNSIAWGATPYKLYLGDKEIKFDSAPYEVNNRLLVPIRTISEATGAKVGWDGKTNTVTVYRKEDRLNLTIGSSVVSYNDITIPLDVAPILKNGRTFLPLRFISEWLGLQVNYEGSFNSIPRSNKAISLPDSDAGRQYLLLRKSTDQRCYLA
ncbi:MAG: copper amine oxidase N-terminal domain-containing protein [Clostridiales bacterium]|jgi:hypothetical protein|nr:copper amine oxidase N-terminal domain-containing protein [Clostridiales bacterium]